MTYLIFLVKILPELPNYTDPTVALFSAYMASLYQ